MKKKKFNPNNYTNMYLWFCTKNQDRQRRNKAR